ncbi:MAG: hypothetical protein J6S69_05325 [Proteobacteria bacterium]|jgi:hypothetical protein|nr:hypothetical protein [Pseudomonadota bacterium]
MEFDKTYIIIAIAVIVVIGFIISMLRGNELSKAIKLTKEDDDPQHIIDAIDNDKTADVPTVYNQCIKSFWDAYDREVATKLVKALAERDDQAKITQHWLKTVIEVEPELARNILGAEFIQNHFDPDVAAQCGSCCGGSCNSKKSCKSCK